MKKILLLVILLTGTLIANGQLSTGFEMPLGTFQGSGNIAGGFHTIKLVNGLGNFLITYGGATKCTAILSETDTAGLYQEIDLTLPTGKPAPNSCKEKGFVYFVNQGSSLIYHWGATKEEAMAKPAPISLKRIKR